MEQIDILLNGKKIVQDPDRFMFGIDAIILSHFTAAEIKRDDNVIDLGTGTGIIPLLLESVTEAQKFFALEVQQDSAKMAKKSVILNGLEKRIDVIEGDIREVEKLFKKHSFEVVVSNPPYMINEHGKQNDGDAKSIARHEILCNLDDVVRAADYLLQPHGKFFMIHRPFRLPEIFSTLKKYSLEPKRMQLVSPTIGKEPNIVMIEARKNANPRLKIEPELKVYSSVGKYSNEVEKIYDFFKKSDLD